MNEIVIKPVESGALDELLKRYHLTPAAPAGNTPSSADGDDALSGETAAVPDAKLVEIFIKESSRRLDSLREALGAGDARRAAREAHTLKSSSAYFQAKDMHEAAARLEQMADHGELGAAKPVLEKLEESYARLRARLEQYRN